MMNDVIPRDFDERSVLSLLFHFHFLNMLKV